jgi:hypothetical protein
LTKALYCPVPPNLICDGPLSVTTGVCACSTLLQAASKNTTGIGEEKVDITRP